MLKKILESLKDILYDSVDYIIMIGIIGIVVFIIGWRLDLLFANDALDLPPKNHAIVEDDSAKDPDPIVDDQEEQDIEEPIVEDDIVENEPDEPKDPIVENPVGTIIKIVIPPGSLPSKIGNILESNGLVTSKGDFVQKSQELKLDTKLKSGSFEIEVGSSLEEIIKLIAK
ncbi:hypothetical protein [Tissierella sp.]|uniref:hypothetical protein n=1 Tax=Tissierella sp. TaxID=41274 RepID=UPI0028631833|nr:hypothetical protein [Tissierella sp.]MDR7857264.1 hypothetical protein [Tissierella sp.]